MKKYLIWIIIIAIIGGGSAAYYFYNTSNSIAEELPMYDEYTVKQEDLKIDYVTDGSLEIPIFSLKFKTSGTIETISASVGDYITEEDILATLNKDDLETSIRDTEITLENEQLKSEKNQDSYYDSLANYNYTVEKLETTYDNLKNDYDIMLALKDVYPASEIDSKAKAVETALNEYNNYKATGAPEYSETKAIDQLAIEKAQSNYDSLLGTLENTELKSFIEGEIIKIDGIIGQSVSQESTVMKLQSNNDLYITTKVQELDLVNIFEDQLVYAEFDAIDGMTLSGKVATIVKEPIIDNNGIVSYEVIIELDEYNDRLMNGMSTTLAFILLEKNDVILIPNKAVQKLDSNQYVFVKDAEGVITKRKITCGVTDGIDCEVIEGLNAGEIIVIER